MVEQNIYKKMNNLQFLLNEVQPPIADPQLQIESNVVRYVMGGYANSQILDLILMNSSDYNVLSSFAAINNANDMETESSITSCHKRTSNLINQLKEVIERMQENVE